MNDIKRLPDAEYVRRLFHYDPTTGEFLHKTRTPDQFRQGEKKPSKASCDWFNARFAGKPAGTKDAKGYGVIKIDYVPYRAHRIAWLYVYGVEPEHEIDHINLDKSDNRIVNLRQATRSQNARNRKSTSNTGVKGVCFDKQRQSFIASICTNGKRQNLGRFKSASAAALAYRAAAENLHGEFRRL